MKTRQNAIQKLIGKVPEFLVQHALSLQPVDQSFSITDCKPVVVEQVNIGGGGGGGGG